MDTLEPSARLKHQPVLPVEPGVAARPARTVSAEAAVRLDRAWHAAEGRATSGLSLLSPFLAWRDWAAHIVNAPFLRADLAWSGADQWRRFGEALLGEKVIVPAPNDHRFVSPLWENPPFHALYQGFLLAEEWWAQAARRPSGVAKANQRIVSFSARQWVDVFSPSNIPWLNPEVIDATISSGGRNLQAGFRNFLTDAEETLTGCPARSSVLKVGRDLGVTPGKVVFRNRLIELIQYAPTTNIVRPEPVLIIPAWIMKYYILDLSPHNSLIRWLVAQGYTVFAISWRNPDVGLRNVSLDDYREEGVMAAIEVATAIAKGARLHATGYCLGGTLLAIAAAAMAHEADERLASVTMFCAQTDFTEAGELQLFINEDQLSFLEDVMSVQGYLDSRQMAGAFQMLRSNDLVWSRAIKSYLLGEREHPNDLMAWNADGTRMPARMHGEYLRQLFLDNDLAEGRFAVGNRAVSIRDIRAPFFAVGTETDHIAPWRSVFKIHLLNDGDVTFVLTSGGHNAGVVSEPGHPRRHFHIARREPGGRFIDPDDWRACAESRVGSWWPAWLDWLNARSGQGRAAPEMGSKKYRPLADAPGTYVFQH